MIETERGGRRRGWFTVVFFGFVGIFGRGSEEEEMEQVLLSCVTDSFSEHINLCDHIILLHFGMTLSLSLSEHGTLLEAICRQEGLICNILRQLKTLCNWSPKLPKPPKLEHWLEHPGHWLHYAQHPSLHTGFFQHPGPWSHHAQLMVIKEGPMDVTWIVRQLLAALVRNWLVKRVPILPERVLRLQLLLLLSSLACQSYKVPGYNFCNAEQAKPQQQQDVPSMHTRWYCALPTSLLPTKQWVNLPAAFPTTPILFSNTSHPAFALSLSLLHFCWKLALCPSIWCLHDWWVLKDHVV